MIIGCPKEIKTEEYRVGVTPEICKYLTEKGHTVLVEKSAGTGAGFPDETYRQAGAHITASAREVYSQAELIIKVKEPQKEEIPFLSEGQILFSIFLQTVK